MQITSFKEIDLPSLTDKTIILIDLDNTLFTSSKMYGSYEYFVALVKETMKERDYSKLKAINEVYGRWLQSQTFVPVEVVDHSVYDFLDNINRLGINVFGFTARGPSSKDITAQQLNQLNLNWGYPNIGFTASYDIRLTEGEDTLITASALLNEGVVFCHYANSKGKIFADFFNTLSRNLQGLVVRIINYLNLQLVLGIVKIDHTVN